MVLQKGVAGSVDRRKRPGGFRSAFVSYTRGMVELRRTVRVTINPPGAAFSHGTNGFGGTPPMVGLGRHYEIDATCRGVPNAVTGYLINIKEIDSAIRNAAVPVILHACDRQPLSDPRSLLPAIVTGTASALASQGVRLFSLRWRLSPTYSVEMSPGSTETAVLRQQFDLAAAHRLHVPSMSDEANRATFGKCNNPAGHGHNYRIETAVNVPASRAEVLPLMMLEEVVGRTIIDRFDHKHLSVDTPEFRPPQGVNPSVENIARVFFSLLAPEIVRASGGGATLRSITVWETDRTCATYPASG